MQRQTTKSKVVPTTKPKPRKQLKKVQQKTVDEDILSYYLALADPFHEGARGAKVPDQFSCPTITQTIRASLTATADASGNSLIIVTPNPLASTIAAAGDLSDATQIVFVNGSTSSPRFWGVDKTSFAGKLDNYRVVGYGVRITGLSSMTNSSGKFIFGTYPVNTNFVTKNFTLGGVAPATNAAYTPQALFTELGVPYNGTTQIPGALVNYPGSRVYSAVEASENIIELCPRMSTPAALNFKPSHDSVMGFDSIGTVGGDSEYLSIDGYEACYIYYTGGVASTSTFDVELVYHLEGKPNMSTGASSGVSAIQPSAKQAVSPVKPIGMLKALEAAAREPVVKTVIETGANFIHPMLGRLASTVLSLF